MLTAAMRYLDNATSWSPYSCIILPAARMAWWGRREEREGGRGGRGGKRRGREGRGGEREGMGEEREGRGEGGRDKDTDGENRRGGYKRQEGKGLHTPHSAVV